MENNFEREDYGVTCLLHENEPVVSVCEDPNCSDKLYCNKCLDESDNCIKNHKIISVKTFFTNAYKEEAKESFDYIQIDEMTKKSDTKSLGNKTEELSKYVNYMEQKILNFSLTIKESLSTKIKRYSNQIKENIFDIHTNLIKAEKSNRNIENLPKDITLNSVTEIFKNNKTRNGEFSSLLKTAKSFSYSKLSEIQSFSKHIIYCRRLADNKLTKNKKLDDIKFDKFEKNLKKSITNLKENLIPKMNKTSLLKIHSPFLKFETSPYNLELVREISDHIQKSYTIDNIFSVFKGFNKRYYLTFISSINNSDIMVMDLESFKIIQTLKGHSQNTFISRHFADISKKKDYLLVTSMDKSANIWLLNQNSGLFEKTVKIDKCHSSNNLYSALILFHIYKKQDFIITSVSASDQLKVWNFDGTLNKEIGDKSDSIFYINSWHYAAKRKYYVIALTNKLIKIFDFDNGEVVQTFNPTPTTSHVSAYIYEINNIPYLFVIDALGTFRVLNIESGAKINEIKFSGVALRCLCFWNEKYILVGGSDRNLKIMDMDNFNDYKTVAAQDAIIKGAQKLELPQYGEVLFTTNADGKMKMWKSYK